MTHEETFRAVLLLVFLLVVPIGLYHRFTSQATGERLDRRQEGLFILATLRPLGAAYWIGLMAWMIAPRSMAWSEMAVPVGLRWAGVGAMVCAGALLVWTFRSLGANLTDTVVTRKKHTLVEHGPYRFIRHPLYTCVAMLTTSIGIIAANWFLLLAGMGVFGLLAIRTRIEEANLIARFGNDYRVYMRRTGRFLPKIGCRRVT
jgi:protein-S-isoprenylcysteine O-methyltransferase Ste14